MCDSLEFDINIGHKPSEVGASVLVHGHIHSLSRLMHHRVVLVVFLLLVQEAQDN